MSGQKFYYYGCLSDLVEVKSRVEDRLVTSGLLTVPLQIQSPAGVMKDTAVLVAGMIGFTVHEGEVPFVQPFQGWSLMLPNRSPFLSKTSAKNIL